MLDRNASLQIKSLADLNFTEDIPEPFGTLEENALHKARTIHQLYQKNCFAEDTGLEVDALNGAPGVYTARYAGPEKDPNKNMDKLIENLAKHTDRSAQFRTVIALIWEGKEYLFEGIVRGKILTQKTGNGGFGYDPVFQPDGDSRSFAQFSKAEKNEISHRAIAMQKIIDFLQNTFA